jgi:hypothetical protein
MDELRSITIQDMKPKLTLRDLFWLVLVVAVGVARMLEKKRSADLNADKRVLELESAQKAEQYRHLDQLNRLLEAKLKEEGYHWEAMRGYKQDGTPYLFINWSDPLPDVE